MNKIRKIKTKRVKRHPFFNFEIPNDLLLDVKLLALEPTQAGLRAKTILLLTRSRTVQELVDIVGKENETIKKWAEKFKIGKLFFLKTGKIN